MGSRELLSAYAFIGHIDSRLTVLPSLSQILGLLLLAFLPQYLLKAGPGPPSPESQALLWLSKPAVFLSL